MCLLLFGHDIHPRYPLIVAANRDEFHRRPSAPAHWWQDRPILAGRDLEAGGTWMGVSRAGRFAVVTNYREPASQQPGLRSRGEAVVEALCHPGRPAEFLEFLRREGDRYNGFNLVFGEPGEVYVYSNRGQAERLPPGLYGLSNHLLETPWPKVVRGKQGLQRYLEGDEVGQPGPLLELLADRQVDADATLPETGVGAEWERLLAPMFIVSPDYGTRASTALLASADGELHFVERGIGPDGKSIGERAFRFRPETP